ncbi:uncharacterized protein LOC141702890 [Apium graveolens]|uniref:uncharacterized protein LOC141702890 n=1 Tax=Apium graveolens TaxID=4045 RepID=UPI003D794762
MLTSINSPIPFATWGIDILGPFPIATSQRKFLIIAIDYFTKWLEESWIVPIKAYIQTGWLPNDVTGSRKLAMRALRYEIPCILVTDNGTQFNNEEFRKYCEENEIELRFTSVAHPQANGTTYKVTTGATLFMLAYGAEVVVPVEI